MEQEIYMTVDGEKEEPQINVDGRYFSELCGRMQKKFDNQINPEKRIQTLKDNAISIFRKIQKLQTSKNV